MKMYDSQLEKNKYNKLLIGIQDLNRSYHLETILLNHTNKLKNVRYDRNIYAHYIVDDCDDRNERIIALRNELAIINKNVLRRFTKIDADFKLLFDEIIKFIDDLNLSVDDTKFYDITFWDDNEEI